MVNCFHINDKLTSFTFKKYLQILNVKNSSLSVVISSKNAIPGNKQLTKQHHKCFSF